MYLKNSQNQNVNRAHTSEHRVYDLHRPDRCTPMKVLVEKKFEFVELVWSAYIAHNKPDIRYVIIVYVYIYIHVTKLLLYMYMYFFVFRPIEDEEPSGTGGEVEDGTALSDADSDDN